MKTKTPPPEEEDEKPIVRPWLTALAVAVVTLFSATIYFQVVGWAVRVIRG